MNPTVSRLSVIVSILARFSDVVLGSFDTSNRLVEISVLFADRKFKYVVSFKDALLWLGVLTLFPFILWPDVVGCIQGHYTRSVSLEKHLQSLIGSWRPPGVKLTIVLLCLRRFSCYLITARRFLAFLWGPTCSCRESSHG